MKKFTLFLAAVLCAAISFATNYVKTDLETLKNTDVVLIVATTSGSTYAMSNDNGADGAPKAVSVTVSGTSIETEATNILWNITYNATDSTFTVNVAGGTNKLYCNNDNNGVRVGTRSANTFKITSNYIYNTTQKRYLGVYNKSDWRCYTSYTTKNIKDQTFAFYVKVPVPATGIALDKNTLSLDKGATGQLTATLTPEDATTEVVWATDNDEVATVANGLVTAVGVGSATITATVTPAEGTTYTATCAVTVVAAPDAPTFTVADEVFEGSMNVAIAAAEGMKIYYTTNGDEPTTASTEYTAPFEITATTTVKAIAYDETNAKASVVATKTYTKAMTCAEANAAAASAVINLNTVTVVYVNGSNTYVADATGGTLVYKKDFGLKAGQVVKGLKGTMKIYNNLPEIEPSVGVSALTITEGTVPDPTALTAVPTMDNINQYVRINGVTISATTTWKSSDSQPAARTLKVAWEEDSLTLYNTFLIDQTFEKGDYNIVGFVSCYGTTIQIAVQSATAVYNVMTDVNDATMGTVTGDGDYEEGTEITLTATANTGYKFVNWTDLDDQVVSTDAAYTFTVTEEVALIANFQKGTSTALDNASSAKAATKRLENGVLIIEKNGIRYNAQGTVIE